MVCQKIKATHRVALIFYKVWDSNLSKMRYAGGISQPPVQKLVATKIYSNPSSSAVLHGTQVQKCTGHHGCRAQQKGGDPPEAGPYGGNIDFMIANSKMLW